MDKKMLESLAVEVKNGNTEAFKDIYTIMYNPLYRLIYRTVKDETLTQDIIQDTFVSAIENIWMLKKPSMISSWLFSIAANKCKDVLKKKKPSLFSEFEDYQIENIEDRSSDTILANSVESSEMKDMINEILDLMPADNRLCLLMKYQEGMPVKSIAAALEISESTVKGRLLRGRKQIISEVNKRRKKGTSIFGLSPWLLFIKLLKQSECAGAVLTGAASSDAAFASIAAAASAGTSGTAAQTAALAGAASAATGASSAATAVTAATAAKIAVASGVIQKAVIGVVSAAIVTASTTAAITITDEAKKHKAEAETAAYSYNSTSNLVYEAEEANATAYSENNEDIEPTQIQESKTERKNIIESIFDKAEDILNSKDSDEQNETKPSETTKKQISFFQSLINRDNDSEQENTSSITDRQTTKAGTTAATTKKTTTTTTKRTTTTTKPTTTTTTTKRTTTTTKRTTTTTKRTTTTTKRTTTTTKRTTTTTTTKRTTTSTTAKRTTSASNATVAVTVKNEDGSTRNINLSFKPGEVINQSTVYDKLYDQYDIDALVVVKETTAEAGKTYTATAY